MYRHWTSVLGRTTPLRAERRLPRLPSGPTRRTTAQSYVVVRVRLEPEDVHAKVHAFQPTPGMPADVFIKTGERTFFEYIMRPSGTASRGRSARAELT